MTILTKLLASPVIASGLMSGAPPESINVGDFLAKSNLDIYIEDGVATLCGHAGSETDSLTAETMALKIAGVEEVRNYTSFS